MSALAIAPDTDPSFLSDLQAARREALGVLRTVLAALTPKPGSPPQPPLTLLREARLAAVDVLALLVPRPSEPDSSLSWVRRLSEPDESPRQHSEPDSPPSQAALLPRVAWLSEPGASPSTNSLQPTSQPHTITETAALPAPTPSPIPSTTPPPPPRTPSLSQIRTQLSPLLRARTPSPAKSLLNRVGAAP